MKRKLSSLKPNECIHIRTEKEAKKIAKLAEHNSNITSEVIHNSFSKRKLPFCFAISVAGGLIFGKTISERPIEIPASDFIKPKSKLKKRVKALEDAVFSKTTIAKTELNELPEKWCVRVTEENKGSLLKWLNKHSECLNLPIDFFVYNDFRTDAWKIWPTVEISFADFKRLVLKEGYKEVRQVGKWYKTPEYGKSIYFVTSITTNDVKAYGFDSDGKWVDESWGWTNPEQYPTDTPATDEEVKAALIAEAETRGFKEGVKVDLFGRREATLKGEYKYMPRTTLCGFYFSIGENEIFNEYYGKWATIIDQPKEIDWSVPGQLVSDGDGLILMTLEGDSPNEYFRGVVIKDTTHYKGYVYEYWYKGFFKLHTEPLTINPAQ